MEDNWELAGVGVGILLSISALMNEEYRAAILLGGSIAILVILIYNNTSRIDIVLEKQKLIGDKMDIYKDLTMIKEQLKNMNKRGTFLPKLVLYISLAAFAYILYLAWFT